MPYLLVLVDVTIFVIVVFTEAGINPTLPLAIMRGSGMSSCSLLPVAYECGNASAAAVYY